MAEGKSSISRLPNAAEDGGIPRVVEAVTNVHDAVDRLAAKTSAAVGALDGAVGAASDATHQAVDRATGVAAAGAEWLSQRGDMLVARGRSAEADARAFVAAHPWQSILGALAVGYLLGRRHHR